MKVALLQGYRVLLNDEQLDIFACSRGHWHLLQAQLSLDAPVDQTLCGSLLPSAPRWRELRAEDLTAEELCVACKKKLPGRRVRALSAMK